MTSEWIKPVRWAAALVAAAALARTAEAQHVTIDGSLSPGQTLAGPNYTIGANLGKQVGGNLFQSFGLFSLSSGESATFTGPAAVSNVIGRVTSGSQSSIDGAIKSAISGANLYLINPAGIVFGPNATINVSGSFRAASADYLKLADGVRFQATNPEGSTLSAAAPAAFGFLGAAPPAITVNGATLSVSNGRSFALAGGTVNLTNATLKAPAGTIHITGVASAGEVPAAPGSGQSTLTARGVVNVTQNSLIDVSDPSNSGSGGSIYIRAGNLTVDHSEINGDNYGPLAGGVVLLSGDSALSIIDNSNVHAFARAGGGGTSMMLVSGASGAITIDTGATISIGSTGVGSAGALGIIGNAVALNHGATVESVANGSGSGGAITIAAQSMSVLNGAAISSDSFASGTGADVSVAIAGPLLIEGSVTAFTGILTGNEPGSTAAAGNITLSAASLTIDGGEIGSATSGAGNGGNVSVGVPGSLAIIGEGGTAPFLVGIAAETNPGSTGNAGAATVTAGALSLADGGQIGGTTFGVGAAGSAVVNIGGGLTIDGSAATGAGTGIFSAAASGSTGAGGPVDIAAGSLAISASGTINTSTSGRGNAGSISITVPGAFTIDGTQTPGATTGVFSDANAKSSGNAGVVDINAGSLMILTGGSIASTTHAAGNAGLVSVAVDRQLTISGPGAGILSTAGLGSGGNGGQIKASAHDVTISDAGSISSSTVSSGNAGDVSLSVPGTLTIDGTGAIPLSFSTGIFAKAGKNTGDAGQVTVTAGNASLVNEGTISTSTSGAGNGGSVSVSAQDLSLSGFGTIASNTSGAGFAGQVFVTATNLSMTSGGAIDSLSLAAGGAGSVTVSVPGALTLDGTGATANLPTGIFANALSTGNAGLVDVSAGTLSIANTNSAISSSTFNAGNAGAVLVSAGSLSILTGASIASSTFSAGNAGNVSVSIPGTLTIDGTGAVPLSFSTGIFAVAGQNTGNAGQVTVTAGNASLVNQGTISTSTFGAGSGGSVSVRAQNLSLSGSGTIASNTFGAGGAGQVLVAAATLSITSGGVIDSLSFAKGAAGSVTVSVPGALTLDGTGASATLPTGIFANALAAGDAGVVDVSAGTLSIANPNSAISSSTFSTGNAGAIVVSAGSLSLVNSGDILGVTTNFGNAGAITVSAGTLSINNASISSSSFAAGNAGQVLVGAGTVTILGDGEIATKTTGTGAGGNITLAATGNIVLSGAGPQITAASSGTGDAGSILVSANNLTEMNGASISTAAASANGGNITLSIRDLLYLVDSKVTTSVRTSTGNGGNITIDPQLLVLNDSSIIAQAVAGHGGNITITANNFVPSSDSIVSASSALGISGSVEVIGPRVDLNGSLVVLSSELRDAAAVLRTSCDALNRKQSSLVDAGHGGPPQDTETTIPALYIADRDLGRDVAPPPDTGAMLRGGRLQIPPERAAVHLTMGCS